MEKPKRPLDSSTRLGVNPARGKRLLASRVFLVVSVLFIFSAGWLLGSQTERGKTALDLSKFWRVYSLIAAEFPGEIDEQKAIDGAIDGLVESIGDPYSSYLSKDEFTQLNEDLRGEFEGIGAVLTQKDSKIVVVEPIEDSPALRAGLKKDDEIIAVDGASVAGQTLEEVVIKIRGQKGTLVSLTIQRGDQELKLEITRDTIDVKTVNFEKRGEVGVIRITQFGDDTPKGVKEAIESLESQGVKKYLLDVRDNPGGYLGTVTKIAGYFLPPDSVVVKQVYKGDEADELKTSEPPLVPTKPVFVYINGGSASASEILAGALRDHGRGILLGQKSFGKGSVQDILTLRGGTGLRLTIAEWLTPNGDHINHVGIEPNHKIKEGEDEAELSEALSYINSR